MNSIQRKNLHRIRIPKNCRDTLRAEFSVMEVGYETEVCCHIFGSNETWHDSVRGDGHSYRGPADIPDIYAWKKETYKHFRQRIRAICYALNLEIPFSKKMENGPEMARLTGRYFQSIDDWIAKLQTREQFFGEKYKIFHQGEEIPISETGYLNIVRFPGKKATLKSHGHFLISESETIKWNRDYVAKMLFIKTDYILQHKCDICGKWSGYSLYSICDDCGKIICYDCSTIYDSDNVCMGCADKRE